MPEGGARTPLTFSYSWGQSALEAQFAGVFQPREGIFAPGLPLAPPEREPTRLWDFPVGVNTIYTPRAYEPVSFAELRALAEAHDLTRLAIETRKDQLEKLDWHIRPAAAGRRGFGRAAATDAQSRCDRLTRFWRRPDGERPFATWLRELLEDLLVIDAPALEVRRNRAGEVIGLDVVDGATIKLLVDDTGRRPPPPAPAYEQVIHGRPWKLLTADELIYWPRNPRPHKAYGFSPVEQIVMTINIGLRRQAAQLQHFTEGNVPPGLLTAPEGWNAEQIRQFQEWFDAVLAGNSAARSRLVWAPSGARYQAFKEAPYKDEFDEWLARIVCYAFSLPATAFTRQVNRATAETAQESALAEGLAPLMGWVKRLADHVIQDRIGEADLEFAWSDLKTIEPKEQAELLAIYVKEGIKTRNEARGILGDDPLPGGDALTVDTPQGPLPVATSPSPALFAAPLPRRGRGQDEGANKALSARREAGEVDLDGTAGILPAGRLEAGAPEIADLARSLAAPLRKDGFDPEQPRVPAGSPDGGQWTGEGGDGAGSPDPDASAGAGPPLHDYPQPGDGDEARVWERFPNPDFRNSLAVAEQTADKPNFGYGEVNARSGALGRYQMTSNALRAVGMTDAHGDWTGKYGIQSAAQFLANPEAQERALTDFLNDTERQLRANGSFGYLGADIDGRVARFTVTRGGLIAAGHREGAGATHKYLEALQNSGFSSARANLTRESLRVETRLRTFAGAPYE